MLRPAFVLLLAFTLLLGGAYPAGVALVARVAFPRQAAGSVLRDDRGEIVGSALVGQPFSGPGFFWGRPSAAGAVPYDGRASGGSNQGPSSPALAEAVRARVALLRGSDPGNAAAIPVDLVTASGSGLDPHVSPAAALWQVRRVARARGLPEDRVRALVLAHVDQPFLGLFGAPRVNVLAVNAALDALAR